jgi:hypothetical protein
MQNRGCKAQQLHYPALGGVLGKKISRTMQPRVSIGNIGSIGSVGSVEGGCGAIGDSVLRVANADKSRIWYSSEVQDLGEGLRPDKRLCWR